jgi:hypothetical protein
LSLDNRRWAVADRRLTLIFTHRREDSTRKITTAQMSVRSNRPPII